MDSMEIVLGLVVGVIITLIISKLYAPKSINNSAKLADKITQKDIDIKTLEVSKSYLEGELNSLKKQLSNHSKNLDELVFENQKLIRENGNLAATNQSLQSKQKEISEIEDKFKKEFERIAGKIMAQNAASFNTSSHQSLKGILDPLKERMAHFEKGINDKYLTEAKDKASLKTEIAKLVELNTKLSDDATNLTNALKGSNKQHGNWGEVILEKVLERSGLEKGTEFKTQEHIQTENGSTKIPDAVVFLPDNKQIIIDSKVSLIAYERMVNAETEEQRDKELRLHVTSLKGHIKELSDKNYYDNEAFNSPEFTLLFIPIEASFSIALRADTDLFSYGWDRNIIIVSPTTMLATLRTVASIWKHDKQTRHVLEIAKEGGALHDKFVAFVEDLQKIQKSIAQSQTAYDSAFNKLSSGKGNIINRTVKLKTLGAKANKALSSQIVEKAQDTEISFDE